jgi:hypothetical protein
MEFLQVFDIAWWQTGVCLRQHDATGFGGNFKQNQS